MYAGCGQSMLMNEAIKPRQLIAAIAAAGCGLRLAGCGCADGAFTGCCRAGWTFVSDRGDPVCWAVTDFREVAARWHFGHSGKWLEYR